MRAGGTGAGHGMAMESQQECPACSSPAAVYALLDGWGYLLRCHSCRLGFAHPLYLPEGAHATFEAAYSGQCSDAAMEMFAHRLCWRQDLALLGLSRLGLAPAHHKALDWIGQHVPPGATVCDVGCGPGLFLDELRRHGYRTVGIEPASSAAEAARSRGHSILVGAMEQLSEAPAADVVVSFFVLHHTPVPLPFVTRIRSLYPRCPLVLAEHDFSHLSRRQGPADVPPRRLTWWTPEALERLLLRAGYHTVSVVSVPAPPYYHRVEGTLAGLYTSVATIIPRRLRAVLLAAYLAAKSLLAPVLGRAPVAATGATRHLLAVALPEEW